MSRHFRRQRDIAWRELAEIRAVLKADPEESTLDEARRVMASLDRYANGHQGSCWCCELVGMKNQELDAAVDLLVTAVELAQHIIASGSVDRYGARFVSAATPVLAVARAARGPA